MKNILIITLGGTPQVVTETLYALVVNEGWVPDRVILVTTSGIRRLCQTGDPARGLAPLTGRGGKWSACLQSLGLTSCEVCLDILVPVAGEPGAAPLAVSARARSVRAGEIADIRTAEEASAFAEAIHALLQGLAADPGNSLHVSLAGGRKTMSYMAGLALSLVARADDRLTHVLVAPEAFERRARFWWPSQLSPASGTDPDGAPWTAQDARIELHDVPVVPLAAFGVPGSRSGFEETVELARSVLTGSAQLIIDTRRRTISLGSAQVARMPKLAFALYHLAALARIERWSCLEEAGLTWPVLFHAADDAGRSLRDERLRSCLAAALATGTSPAHINTAWEAAGEKIAGHAKDYQVFLDWALQPFSRLQRRLREGFPAGVHGLVTAPSALNLAIPGARILIR